MEDYYNVFFITRASFSKERVEKYYLGFKKILKSNFETYKDDVQKLSELHEFELKIDNAYQILSNDEKRQEYNESLDRLKQRKEEVNNLKKEEEEKYSCFSMYDALLIKSVKYRRSNDSKSKLISYEYVDENNSGTKIEYRPIGSISYSTDQRMAKDGLYRYEVIIISTKNPEQKKYKVISRIDDMRMQDDDEYKKAVFEKLFSEENLEKSKHENYEYLGEIVNNNNEYSVAYNQEKFCAAIRFGNKLRRKVDKTELQADRKSKKFIRKKQRDKKIFDEER